MLFCAYASYLISSSCVREIVRGISAIYVNRLKKVHKTAKRAKIFQFQFFFGSSEKIRTSGRGGIYAALPLCGIIIISRGRKFICMFNFKTKNRSTLTDTPIGPSEKIRTSGLLNPIQARYQLRYTRIFTLQSCFSSALDYINTGFQKMQVFF